MPRRVQSETPTLGQVLFRENTLMQTFLIPGAWRTINNSIVFPLCLHLAVTRACGARVKISL
ncbi:MAG: hypothetical protein ACJ746_22640 [Bryobacteraceae bacterium]